jgi:FkbM family methyltransferase
MGLWKLKWALSTALHPSNYPQLKRELKKPSKFYTLAFLKFKTGLNKKTKELLHISGQKIMIHEFMDLFKIQEIYVESCYDIQLKNPKPNIIDVGANKGYFAMRMKYLFPEANIICAEPVGDNFNKMREQLNANNYSCELIQKAIGFPERKDKIFLDPTNSGAHSLFKKNKNLPCEEIDVISLKTLFDSFQINHCDLLKLDCEGAEKEIIMSMDQELASKIDQIFYEPMSHLYTAEELNSKLRELGYKVEPKGPLFFASRI